MSHFREGGAASATSMALSAADSSVASTDGLTWQCPPRSTTPAFEPLAFTKLPVTRGPQSTSGGSIFSPSTDSECVVSDSADMDGNLSRSPSLLTSLIQSHGRQSARTTPATTPGVSPVASPMPLPGAKAPSTQLAPAYQRPILRRLSSGAGSNGAERGSAAVGSGLGLATKPTPAGAGTPIYHRRSCLKFAVTPRPLQLQPTPNSFASSRRTSSPAAPTSSDEDDDEDGEVATPAFHSDDAGYQEDSEDGFTTDEDEEATETTFTAPRWPRTWATRHVGAPTPILSRPVVAVVAPDVTTDDGADVPQPRTQFRKSRIRIRDEEKSARRCTRHRSPPPLSRLILSESNRPAPPAARSPSAADLCRRRSGVALATPQVQSPSMPRGNELALSRGWRSDDNVRSRTRLAAAPPSCLPQRSTSECVESGNERPRLAGLRCTSVKFDVVEDSARRNTCVLSVRRDSAPARVAEVHVLAHNAGGNNESCSGKLKSSLGL